jgi:hypothetical protein
MADNTVLGSRKFYKIRRLSDCFVTEERIIQDKTYPVYTGILADESIRLNAGIKDIDENTILFITPSENDIENYIQIPLTFKGIVINGKPVYSVKDYQDKKINKGDTFLWVKNEFYPLSLNEIKDIEEVDGDLNISYSNGDNKTISLKNITSGYNGIYPISIDGGGNITLEGLYIDEEKNNIRTFDNSIKDGVINSYVEGIGNTSTANYQHVMGKYAKPDDNSIFIIGGGDKNIGAVDNSKNLFTVGFDGTATVENDVIIKKEKIGDIYGAKDIKLSEVQYMHDVVDEDWVVVEKINLEYGEEIGGFSGF